MSVLTILPVKRLDQSKSRLAPVLSQEQRELFVLALLGRTINILKSTNGIDDILVVSRDMRVHALAQREGVLFLKEQGAGLNRALGQATQWSIGRHFSALLILALDVPFLERMDTESIIGMGQYKERVIIIAPDQGMKGTNALFIRPPGILDYRFGFESFYRHWKQAKDKRIEIIVYRSPATGFDVDCPSHYREMLQRGLSGGILC